MFIPTEILAPFLAALSIAETNQWDPIIIYGRAVAITPFVFLLIHLAQLAVNNKPWPSGREIPMLIWKAIAAMIAFAGWALISPSNPLQSAIGGTAIAALLSIFISPILTRVDQIVVRLLRPTPKQEEPLTS